MIALTLIVSGLVLGYLHSDWFYLLSLAGVLASPLLAAILGLPIYLLGITLQLLACLVGGRIIREASLAGIVAAGRAIEAAKSREEDGS